MYTETPVNKMPAKSFFYNDLIIKDLNDGRKFLLYESLAFYAKRVDTIITAPAGFVTDLTSFRPLKVGKQNRAAVIHDWLYKNAMYERKMCDLIFLDALEAVGVNYILRNFMYLGVRIGGEKYFQKIDIKLVDVKKYNLENLYIC